jgi:AcrR family transcriptional regulator
MLVTRTTPQTSLSRLRDPERTRERLLQAASREIYRSGFQSASLNTILSVAGVTKGALYYDFDGKEALGLAGVDEIIARRRPRQVGAPFSERKGPCRRFDRRCSTCTGSARGCTGRLPVEQSGAGYVSS